MLMLSALSVSQPPVRATHSRSSSPHLSLQVRRLDRWPARRQAQKNGLSRVVADHEPKGRNREHKGGADGVFGSEMRSKFLACPKNDSSRKPGHGGRNGKSGDRTKTCRWNRHPIPRYISKNVRHALGNARHAA